MATLTKAPRKKRVRFTMDITFSSVAEKDAFCGRLSSVRDLLTPTGSQTLNNYELLLALFDLAGKQSQSIEPPQQCPSSGSFLKHSGQCCSVGYEYV